MKTIKIITLLIIALTFQLGFSQDGRSLILVHNYEDKAAIDAIVNATEGNIAYAADENAIYVFDGSVWILSSNSNWAVTGNTGLGGTNSFLGHTDDVVMEIRSDDIPMLQFGRRGTLGLDTTGEPDSDPDYEDGTQPLVFVNGDGTTSALQFNSANSQYQPLFFSTQGGSFRLKGSSAGTDLFEIGSVGSANNGALELIIGDDGAEPITFKRFHFSNQTLTEMFRVQGSDNGNSSVEPNIKTRFGININQNRVAIDPTYQTADIGNMANSTLQVEGSLSKSLIRTSTNLTLDEDHYSIIVTDASAEITLPTITSGDVETDLIGREYVIKNTTTSDLTISSYQDNSDTAVTIIPANNVLKIQSDGTLWNQMNNYSTLGVLPICTTAPEPTLPTLSTFFTINNFDDVNGGLELQFTYDSGGVANPITEFQILISSVPYEVFTVTDVDILIPGPDIDITGQTTSTSGENCDTPGTFDHLITISIPTDQLFDGETINLNFTHSENGNTNDDTTCNGGCSIEFYTN